MKIRTLLGLTVIGSAVYAHKRNGGDFSVESMKKSLSDLWAGIRGKAGEVKAKATELADKVPDKAKGIADHARSGVASAAGKVGEATSPSRSATDERYGSNSPLPGGAGRGR